MTVFATENNSPPTSEPSSVRMVIMGPQGSGKGTQAARLAEHYAIPTISTGEIFRTNIAKETELGAEAQKYISQGELVPDSLTNAMVRDRLAADDVVRGFILDGYPRNFAQVLELDTVLGDLGFWLDAVVQLTADRDELLARMAKRAQIEGRADDTPEVIAHRLDIYDEQTAPLVSAYAQRGILVAVDGTGTVEEVTARIISALGSLVG